MTTAKILAIALGLLVVALPGAPVEAGSDEHGATKYTLEFIPTHNAPAGASGTMHITVTEEGWSHVRLRVRGLYPNTVYTIWTVFNKLTWKPGDTPGDAKVGAADAIIAYPTFPKEGNGVAPTARIGARFTDGMSLDPGSTFVTDDNGAGHVQVKLDFDLVNQAPVGNADIIRQTVCPAPLVAGSCPVPTASVRITTTWLRTFIGEYPPALRAAMCANYDPVFDRDVYPAGVGTHGTDARFWQCVDPTTRLPRVPRFKFDHFRLADHPDALTHGFIGGSSQDHFIDMVGRRCDLVPSVGAACE